MSNKVFSNKSMKVSLPWVLLLFGIAFFFAGVFDISNKKWLDIVFERLADVLLVGGILGFLVNASRFLGLFKEELEDILYGKEYMGTRKDLETVWNNLSLYLFKERFPQINKELVANIKKAYLPDEENIYYKDYSFTVQIEWEDESKKFVKVTETLSFDVITDTKSSVPLAMECVINVPNKANCESCLSLLQYSVDGEIVSPQITSNYDVNTGSYSFRMSLDLKGKTSYEVVNKREKHYCLNDDCDISFFARHLIHGMQIKITYPKGLQIYHRSRGTINSFRQIPTAPGLIEMKYTGIILPKQGIIFIIKP